MATYAGQARDLRPWLDDAQINTDRNLRPGVPGGDGEQRLRQRRSTRTCWRSGDSRRCCDVARWMEQMR